MSKPCQNCKIIVAGDSQCSKIVNHCEECIAKMIEDNDVNDIQSAGIKPQILQQKMKEIMKIESKIEYLKDELRKMNLEMKQKCAEYNVIAECDETEILKIVGNL
jgi:hypothetical protein